MVTLWHVGVSEGLIYGYQVSWRIETVEQAKRGFIDVHAHRRTWLTACIGLTIPIGDGNKFWSGVVVCYPVHMCTAFQIAQRDKENRV